jgi:5-methyltetrahydrofolate--homocysteine methyltransferase
MSELAERAAGELVGLSGKPVLEVGQAAVGVPEPYGQVCYDDVYSSYAEQIREARDAKYVVISGAQEIQSYRIAVLAATDLGKQAVAVLALGSDGKLPLSGTDLATAAIILDRLGASAVGMAGTEDVGKDLGAIRAAAKVTGLPLAYSSTSLFAPGSDQQAVDKLIGAGVSVFVGADETALAGKAPKSRTVDRELRLAGPSRWLPVGGGRPFVAIGERINPTGRKKLRELLGAGDFSMVETDSVQQTNAGADMLDVNVGVPAADEPVLMREAVQRVMSNSGLPLSLDSANPLVLETGLKMYPGKALINSMNGEESSMANVIPLAKRYGAAVVCLCLDETGVPVDCATRIAIAEKIIARATDAGIPREDLVIDCLVVTAGAQQEAVMETVKAVKEVSERLKLNTVLGCSNVSFGLPERGALNTAYLAMCIAAGLTTGIVDITNEGIREAILASDVITNRDEYAARYINYFREKKRAQESLNA